MLHSYFERNFVVLFIFDGLERISHALRLCLDQGFVEEKENENEKVSGFNRSGPLDSLYLFLFFFLFSH